MEGGKKIISLEFNELCPELLTRWMNEGKLPNFRKFHDQSQVLTAVADEPGPDNLEPWIQWYSMHTGLPYSFHGVQNLTDGPQRSYSDIWQLLAAARLKVANCGSMNAKALAVPGSLFVPDPWCRDQRAYPEAWSSYHRLVSGLVQDHSRGAVESIGWKDYIAFLRFAATHGLSAVTVMKLGAQIFSDSIMRNGTSWKRVALLDLIQFDVFCKHWLKERPDFSSFFLNSTAHYQHAYWHCAFPEQFSGKAADTREIEQYGSAILHGYQQMDALLEKFFRLENSGATLMLCTGLSQQSIGRTDQVLYRLRDPAAFASHFGLRPVDILPVMSEQFSFKFATTEEATDALATLSSPSVDGAPLLWLTQDGNSLLGGAYARREMPGDSVVAGLGGATAPRYSELFYRLPTIKATTHHPKSLIWIKVGSHKVHTETVSILDWLPTMLDLYGLRNSANLPGKSFLPSLN